jgi:hypothetical protein
MRRRIEMKKTLLIALALVPLLAFGDGDGDKGTNAPKGPTMVSLMAKATDVRAIIADLFGQAKQNYVLQPGVQAALFLSLDKIEFEQALMIVCTQAKLEYQVKDGIYFITIAKPAAPTPVVPSGTLDKTVLTHKLTTKMSKTDIRSVFAEFGRQTKVTLQIDRTVPNFKLDAFLTNVSLGSALSRVTDATGLKYKFTDHLSILIYKPDDGNKVSISGN